MYCEANKWIGEALLAIGPSKDYAIYKALYKACLKYSWEVVKHAQYDKNVEQLLFVRKKIGLICRELWFVSQASR